MLYKNAYKKLCSLSAILLLVLFLSADFYAAPGDLDPTFGNGGKVITDISSSDFANSAVLQPDGKLIVAGAYDAAFYFDFVVVRYNSNGSLDASFGIGGIAMTDFDSGSSVAHAVALQPDGKIVAAGFNGSNFALARFNSNGSLDSTFGNGGKVTTDFFGFSDSAQAIIIQPDGKIVAAGIAGITTSTGDFALVRYNSDGTLDSTFGSGGKVTTDFNGQRDQAFALVLQADGKLAAVGTSGPGNASDFALARYNSNGSLDSGFGNGGKVITDFAGQSDLANSLVVQTDGKLVAGGNAGLDFGLARYNPDGMLDSTFGNGGKVTTDFAGGFDVITELLLQASGRIIAVGQVSINGANDFGLARFNGNGTLDTTFGAGGKINTDFGGGDSALGAIIQPDGKIVAAGYTANANFSASDFALARYLGDLITRRALFDFDGDGKADVSVFRPSNGAWYLLQSQAGFSGTQFGSAEDKPVAADYDSDGKTDIGVFRPSNGTWYLLRSQQGSTATQFGQAGDVPVPADYDNDGRADIAVFRPSNGTWYLLGSTAGFSAVQFGQQGDVPVAGDFDADGRADQVVFRSSNGTWYLQQSQAGYTAVQFGMNGDVPTTGDFDADGRHDIAVFRPSNGTWYRLNSSNNQVVAVQFGSAEDLPAPADFDGDGRTDIAVFRPSNGSWYLLQSQSGFSAVQFGASGDRPAPSAQQP